MIPMRVIGVVPVSLLERYFLSTGITSRSSGLKCDSTLRGRARAGELFSEACHSLFGIYGAHIIMWPICQIVRCDNQPSASHQKIAFNVKSSNWLIVATHVFDRRYVRVINCES